MPTLTLTLPRSHNAQERVEAEASRFNVVDCGRRWGKTTLGIKKAAEAAIDGLPVGWFSPSYRMLMEAWREAKRILRPITARKNETEKRIELLTGGSIEFWSLDNPDVARGRFYGRVVIDEAASVPALKDAWQHVIRPTLTDLEGDAWFLSTPKGRNFFWELYVRGADPEQSAYAAWQMPTSSNPHISKAEIEQARRELPERVFAQEYLAEFVEHEGTVFRNLRACLGASPTARPHDHKGHYLVIGADWGKQEDFTAFSVFCATCAREVQKDRSNVIRYELQRGRLKALVDRWGAARVLAESNAMGEPIIEGLAGEGVPVIGFATTSQSKQELIESLALALEREEAQWIDDPVWTAELEAYEMRKTPTGRPSYSAPEGFHDDTVIARALAWRAATQGRLKVAFA